MSVSTMVELPLGRTRLVLHGPADGPAVVLVHGLSYPVEVWTELASCLAERGHRVLCVELPGRGQSGFNGGALTLTSLAHHVAQAMESSQLRGPATLVSLSNSDWLITTLAVTFPAKVSRIVWVAPSGLDPRITRAWLPRRRMGQRVMGVWLRHKLLRRMREHQHRSHPEDSASAAKTYAAAIESLRSNSAFGFAVCRQLAQLPPPAALQHLRDQLSALGLPLLVLRFSDEKDSTSEGTRFLLEHLPRCQIRELAGTHMGLIENPQPVNQLIATWLNLTDS